MIDQHDTPVPEITVSHRPFSEQNHVLTDYLEACSVKRPTSSKTVGKNSQIKNQASYNRCHIKLIAYLTAAQRPSNDAELKITACHLSFSVPKPTTTDQIKNGLTL